MPYKIEKRGDKYEVIAKDTGKSKGKSVSLEMAKAHMRALYANEGISKGLKNT
jgi:hypothetical protein